MGGTGSEECVQGECVRGIGGVWERVWEGVGGVWEGCGRSERWGGHVVE